MAHLVRRALRYILSATAILAASLAQAQVGQPPMPPAQGPYPTPQFANPGSPVQNTPMPGGLPDPPRDLTPGQTNPPLSPLDPRSKPPNLAVPYRTSPTSTKSDPTKQAASQSNGTSESPPTSKPATPPTKEALVQGLANVNVGSLAGIPTKNVVDVRESMSLDEVHDLAKMLRSNDAALKKIDSLNRQLRQSGMLGPDQTVMGFANGTVFAGAASNLRADSTSTVTPPRDGSTISSETPRKRED
jgi:hypothetical protein